MPDTNLKAESGKQKAGGVVVPHQPKWHQRLAAFAAFALLRLILFTVRCRLVDKAGTFSSPRTGAVIFCFWHNRLASCMKVYRRYATNRTDGDKIAALVSASKDGAFLSGILELFGVQPVRGSSSRRGPQALREMVAWGERGYDLAITPDGPRGPCYHIHDGVTSLAQLTGLTIVPVAFNLNWKIRLKSWDRFQIPLPFARCEVRVGEPMKVSRAASDAQREELRQELERRLRELTRD
ncbi:MAG: lysophospholipid acyltransferase family protein [Verrucomicrobia bacterium]|nr:lysophospholipid acyltransferase family protein [Verrucomicrobiota bacterium]